MQKFLPTHKIFASMYLDYRIISYICSRNRSARRTDSTIRTYIRSIPTIRKTTSVSCAFFCRDFRQRA